MSLSLVGILLRSQQLYTLPAEPSVPLAVTANFPRPTVQVFVYAYQWGTCLLPLPHLQLAILLQLRTNSI
jgi:hypothetical protein